VKHVALVPACAECGERWLPGDPERWRAEFVDDEPQDLLKFWCPECWRREFAALSMRRVAALMFGGLLPPPSS
jgi:hypothetical protein